MIHDVPGRYIVSRGRALESQKDALGSLDPALAERASTFLANARPEQALVTRCTDADLLVVGLAAPIESATGWEWEPSAPRRRCAP